MTTVNIILELPPAITVVKLEKLLGDLAKELGTNLERDFDRYSSAMVYRMEQMRRPVKDWEAA